MPRIKTPKQTTPREQERLGIAEGFDFENNLTDYSIENNSENHSEGNIPEESQSNTIPAQIDPNRSYSKYYAPKPKTGSRGGVLGRGPVEAKDRKVQFSVTCTQEQKKLFAEAAKKDKRKLPDFICLAIEEYIKNHNLS